MKTRIFLFEDNAIRGFFGEYRFLSNFWRAPTVYEGIEYPTSEHAYQAAKTQDVSLRKTILDKTSGGAKRFGASLPWNESFDKLYVMESVVRDKFSKEPVRSMLLATGERELVEENTWKDTFWGVCNGVGKNHLGRILMQVRRELRKE